MDGLKADAKWISKMAVERFFFRWSGLCSLLCIVAQVAMSVCHPVIGQTASDTSCYIFQAIDMDKVEFQDPVKLKC